MGDLRRWRQQQQSRINANLDNLLTNSTTHANGQIISQGGLNITDIVRRGQQQRTQNAANQFVANQNAAEVAQVEQQAVEDEMEENRARNRGITALAFGQAQQGSRLGRGLFQRRQAGRKIGESLGALAKANAGTLKTARLKTLKATQAADLKRTNPVLGYQSAMNSIYQQMS